MSVEMSSVCHGAAMWVVAVVEGSLGGPVVVHSISWTSEEVGWRCWAHVSEGSGVV